MSKKVNSIKGEEVDFDLFEIKAQINSTEKTSDVLMREKYIDIKRRRKNRKTISELLADQEKNKRMVSKSLKKQQSQEANDKVSVEKTKKPKDEVIKKDTKKRKIR